MRKMREGRDNDRGIIYKVIREDFWEVVTFERNLQDVSN